MDVVLITTFSLIMVFSILNFMFSFLLYRSTKLSLYKHKCFFWFTLIINFFLQGAAQTNHFAILMAYSFALVPMTTLCKMTFILLGEKFPTKLYLRLPVLFYILSWSFHFTGMGFTLSALPLSFMVAIPLAHAASKILYFNRNKSSVFLKFMGVIMSLYIIHTFNFSFFRLDPGAQMWGWPLAYGLYQIIAGILPVISLEFLHNNEATRLEGLVKQRTNELTESNISLHKSFRTNELLFRVLLHDISNSLVLLNHYSAVVNKFFNPKEDENEDEKTAAEKIVKSVGYINSLIEQIREYEAIKSGKLRFEKEPISLNAILTELEERVSENLRNKNLVLDYDTIKTQDREVFIDEKSFLNTVLLNIVTNAIKFSFKGNSIVITLHEEDGYHFLEILDHGLGIPEELIADIFSFNKETSRKGTSGENGTGFGMPIVKEYMLLYGGDIHVDSREATDDIKGYTKMILKFPMKKPDIFDSFSPLSPDGQKAAS